MQSIDRDRQFCCQWRCGVVVITTAQLHSTKPELRFGAGSNHARSMSEIRDGEDLWQWSRPEIRLNAFRRSIIPQKQFTIIIIGSSCKWINHNFHKSIVRNLSVYITWKIMLKHFCYFFVYFLLFFVTTCVYF